MGAWQYQSLCYFVPTQGSWQRQCYVVPSISNTPDGSKANPMKALTKNPMVFMAHPMASTATGRAVVTIGTALITENPMAFLAHPMASTETGRAVVTKGTALLTENPMTLMTHLMASTATNRTVVNKETPRFCKKTKQQFKCSQE